MKRKILAFALAVMMLVSVLPTSVFAADTHDHAECPGEGKVHTLSNCPDAVEKLVVDPLCDEEGYTVYQCPECEDIFRGDLVPALGKKHDYVTVDGKKAPTCEEPGYDEKLECSICEKVKYVNEVPALGGEHSFTIEVEDTRTGDCTNGGSVVMECDKCGYQEEQEFSATKKHTWGAGIIAVKKYPTVKEKGIGVIQCLTCFTTKESVIEANCYHKLVKCPERAATCDKVGYSSDAWYCEECNVYYAAKENFYNDDYTKEMADDVSRIPLANKKVEALVLDKVAHVADPEHIYSVTEVTCLEDGVTIADCAVCGAKEVTIVDVEAAGKHNWELIEPLSKEPTCTTAGIYVYLCGNGNCTEILKKDLEPLGHVTWEESLEAHKTSSMVAFVSGSYTCEDKAVTFENIQDFEDSRKLVGTINIGNDSYSFTYNLDSKGKRYIVLDGDNAPEVEIVEDNLGGVIALEIDGVSTVRDFTTIEDVVLDNLSLKFTQTSQSQWTSDYTFIAPYTGTYTFTNMTTAYRLFILDYMDKSTYGLEGVYELGTSGRARDQYAVELNAGECIMFRAMAYMQPAGAAQVAVTVDITAPFGAPVYQEPGCLKPGSQVWYCTNEGCGEYYINKIAPTGHELETAKAFGNCQRPAYEFMYCTNENCELPLVNRLYLVRDYETWEDMELCVAVDPDAPKFMNENGEAVHFYAVAPADGEEEWNPVKFIGVPDENAHVWDPDKSVVITYPTCCTPGTAIFECLYCDYVNIDYIMPEIDHNMVILPTNTVLSCENPVVYEIEVCDSACCIDTTKTGLDQYKVKEIKVIDRLTVKDVYTYSEGNKIHTFTTDATEFAEAWVGSENYTIRLETNDAGQQYLVLVEGTCGVGMNMYYCTECDEFVRIRFNEYTGHKVPTSDDWSYWTCTKDDDKCTTKSHVARMKAEGAEGPNEHGKYSGKTNKFSNYKDPDLIPEGTWVKPESATCKNDYFGGAYVCAYCNEWINEGMLKANDHKLVDVAEKLPTCLENGHPAGQKCTTCKQIFCTIVFENGDPITDTVDNLIDMNLMPEKYLCAGSHTYDRDSTEDIYGKFDKVCVTGATGINFYCTRCDEFITTDFWIYEDHKYTGTNSYGEKIYDKNDDGYITKDEAFLHVTQEEHWMPYYDHYECEFCGKFSEQSSLEYGHMIPNPDKEGFYLYFHNTCTYTGNNHCVLCCEKCSAIADRWGNKNYQTEGWVCDNKKFELKGDVIHNDVTTKVDATEDKNGYIMTYCLDCNKVLEHIVLSMNGGVDFIIDVENVNAPEGYKNTFSDSSVVKVTISVENYASVVEMWGLNFFMHYDRDVLTLIENGEYAPKFVSDAFAATGVWSNNYDDEYNEDGELVYYDWTANVGIGCNYSSLESATNDNFVLNEKHAIVELYFVINQKYNDQAWTRETSFAITESEATVVNANGDYLDVFEEEPSIEKDIFVLEETIEIVPFMSALIPVEGNDGIVMERDAIINMIDVRAAYKIMKGEMYDNNDELITYDVALDVNKDGRIDMIDIRGIYEYMSSHWDPEVYYELAGYTEPVIVVEESEG